jgi:MoxR-like ATPase
MNAQDIIAAQNLVRRVPVADNVIQHAVKLVHATRPNESSSKAVKDFLAYGAGPRASQFLVLGAKARAAMSGRPTPEIADVNAVALPVLRHRIVTNFNAEAEGMTADNIIKTLL